MQAVFDFGSAWLESSGELTLHDPLAAVCLFHPDICRFDRGCVRVEIKAKETMGATAFISAREGNVEVARWADAGRFYGILSAVLNNAEA